MTEIVIAAKNPDSEDIKYEISRLPLSSHVSDGRERNQLERYYRRNWLTEDRVEAILDNAKLWRERTEKNVPGIHGEQGSS